MKVVEAVVREDKEEDVEGKQDKEEVVEEKENRPLNVFLLHSH